MLISFASNTIAISIASTQTIKIISDLLIGKGHEIPIAKMMHLTDNIIVNNLFFIFGVSLSLYFFSFLEKLKKSSGFIIKILVLVACLLILSSLFFGFFAGGILFWTFVPFINFSISFLIKNKASIKGSSLHDKSFS